MISKFTNEITEKKAVSLLSELFALECGYDPTTARKIRMAAVFHDCGKKYIAKEIEEKPGKLTAYEFEIMKDHTKIGAKMLSSMRGDIGKLSRELAHWHHEHVDGNGYWGLCSSEIPKHVQIVSLCDVLCALLFKRVYKPAWPPDEALAYIKSRAGTQFCPELTDNFISMIQGNSRVPVIFREVSP